MICKCVHTGMGSPCRRYCAVSQTGCVVFLMLCQGGKASCHCCSDDMRHVAVDF